MAFSYCHIVWIHSGVELAQYSRDVCWITPGAIDRLAGCSQWFPWAILYFALASLQRRWTLPVSNIIGTFLPVPSSPPNVGMTCSYPPTMPLRYFQDWHGLAIKAPELSYSWCALLSTAPVLSLRWRGISPRAHKYLDTWATFPDMVFF
jgi:hypothetical protein